MATTGTLADQATGRTVKSFTTASRKEREERGQAKETKHEQEAQDRSDKSKDSGNGSKSESQGISSPKKSESKQAKADKALQEENAVLKAKIASMSNAKKSLPSTFLNFDSTKDNFETWIRKYGKEAGK